LARWTGIEEERMTPIELLANSPTEPTDVVYLELPYVWYALVSFVARNVNKVGS
jgi:hypothetical protein